jgi:two-component system KDP operon response regulator KdpE
MAMRATTSFQSDRGVDLDMVTSGHKRITAMIVDDEPETIRMMKIILMGAGMDVIGAASGLDAIDKCPHSQPDVVLLDLMMPEMDGYETFHHLRTITSAPIMIVSARTLKDDVVEGLQFGADDYITKPFYPPELVARVNTVVRRTKYTPPVSTYSFPTIGLKVDSEAREITFREQKILLPSKEFEVFSVLVRFAPKLVSKEVIAREVWGEDNEKIQNRIKYFIHILRGKLEDDMSNPKLILSREGLGYRLNTDEDPASGTYKHSTPLEMHDAFH